jgi:hypothetical protein
MPAAHDPRQNHLLAALPGAAFERLQPHLKLVSLPLGEALSESGVVLCHVYFPTNSIVSLLYVMADGASAEIAVVGNEGVIGVSLFMGGETTPSRAVVQSAGHALQHAGLIHYSRGRITVIDRAGLEARTCECYAVVKKESDRLLPDSTAA